jgi:hypothetical protein
MVDLRHARGTGARVKRVPGVGIRARRMGDESKSWVMVSVVYAVSVLSTKICSIYLSDRVRNEWLDVTSTRRPACELPCSSLFRKTQGIRDVNQRAP